MRGHLEAVLAVAPGRGYGRFVGEDFAALCEGFDLRWRKRGDASREEERRQGERSVETTEASQTCIS